MEPIKLTKYNEMLIVDNNDGDLMLSTGIGQHKFCKGSFNCIVISETHKAIICRHCKLRIIIPIEVKTYDDLRKELTKQIYREIMSNFKTSNASDTILYTIYKRMRHIRCLFQ